MAKFIIIGGSPVSGVIQPAGSKNALLPILAATLLADTPSTLLEVPSISDAKTMLKLMEGLGAGIAYENYGSIVTVTPTLTNADINKDQYQKIRGSNLLLSPILQKLGKVRGYYPGGDKIGLRSMAAHIDGFVQSGYIVTEHKDEGYFDVERNEAFTGEEYCVFLFEPSATATENVILINVLGKGIVTIENAACEPQIIDLCTLLQKMGADISGVGTNRLVIKKVEKLNGATHMIVKDHVYIASFIVFALVTGGDLYIQHVVWEYLQPLFPVLKYFNVSWEVQGTTLHIPPHQTLRLNEGYNIYENVGIYSQPWPLLPTDVLPLIVMLATQAEGEFLFFEKMYADRLKNITKLEHLGAELTLLDDHRVKVRGKTPLKASDLTCPDLRSGIVYLAAMLAASGTSTLYNVEHIERAYPKIEEVLTSLGAQIQKYEDTL
jgi:UDP-N-acetylglucosamine 1-carboxyvinyltransferase